MNYTLEGVVGALVEALILMYVGAFMASDLASIHLFGIKPLFKINVLGSLYKL